jgi:hypothetical protein
MTREVTNCLGMAFIDFTADPKTLPEMRCYGVTRFCPPPPSSELRALPNPSSSSLRSLACLGSTSLIADNSEPSLTYTGVVIQVHETARGAEIEEETEKFEEEGFGAPGRVWAALSREAVDQGYPSTLLFFVNRVAHRSALILDRNAKLFSLALANPVSSSRKVLQRCDEILDKAGSIAVRANIILRRLSGIT